MHLLTKQRKRRRQRHRQRQRRIRSNIRGIRECFALSIATERFLRAVKAAVGIGQGGYVGYNLRRPVARPPFFRYPRVCSKASHTRHYGIRTRPPEYAHARTPARRARREYAAVMTHLDRNPARLHAPNIMTDYMRQLIVN